MGFGLRVFYVVVYGSLLWVLSCGSYYGSLVGLGLRHRFLWFGC